MTEYDVVERLSEGLVGVQSEEHGRQLWGLTRIRKDTTCARCRLAIQKGAQAFRPMGNAANRYHRLCQDCVKRG